MNERGYQAMWIAPIVASVLLIVITLLLLVGSMVGGGLGTMHSALRDLFTGADKVVIDQTSPDRLDTSLINIPVTDTQLAPTMPTVFVPEVLTSTVPLSETCSSFQFAGSLSIQDDRLSFGRFNVVNNTEPYGEADPLTSWKLVQMESLDLDLDSIQEGTSVTIPVDKTVSVRISDPFSQETLFSAEWTIAEIEVRGAYASINARLAPNLSAVRVNNAISSKTLDNLGTVDSGILTMHWTYTEDLAPMLRNHEPILAAMGGSAHMDRCLR